MKLPTSEQIERAAREWVKTNYKKLCEVKDNDECWLWKGSLTGHPTHSYGRFKFKQKQFIAHRVFYEAFKGNIPKGLVIDHICRVPKCVNPLHLRAVTVAQNTTENSLSPSALNKIKTSCPHGHEYNSKNTYTRIRPNNGNKKERICKACQLKRRRNTIAKRILKKISGQNAETKNISFKITKKLFLEINKISVVRGIRLEDLCKIWVYEKSKSKNIIRVLSEEGTK